jgi:hypothetical protein
MIEDIYINNIGIIFINNNSKYNTIYLNDKHKFNKNKINNFKKQKEDLIQYNNIIKNEFKICMKNWTINHSSSSKILDEFIKEKLIIENIIIQNKNIIKNLDNLIKSY